MPSSRPYSRWIAAIVSMSMYSRIDGASPLVITFGTADATSSSVGNGASTVALKAGRGTSFNVASVTSARVPSDPMTSWVRS
jgi:hypothetical protein